MAIVRDTARGVGLRCLDGPSVSPRERCGARRQIGTSACYDLAPTRPWRVPAKVYDFVNAYAPWWARPRQTCKHFAHLTTPTRGRDFWILKMSFRPCSKKLA